MLCQTSCILRCTSELCRLHPVNHKLHEPCALSVQTQSLQPAHFLNQSLSPQLTHVITCYNVSPLQVSDLVEAAAGLISVLDDLRPLDASSFNAAYEIWKAIAAVPPADRCGSRGWQAHPMSTLGVA